MMKASVLIPAGKLMLLCENEMVETVFQENEHGVHQSDSGDDRPITLPYPPL